MSIRVRQPLVWYMTNKHAAGSAGLFKGSEMDASGEKRVFFLSPCHSVSATLAAFISMGHVSPVKRAMVYTCACAGPARAHARTRTREGRTHVNSLTSLTLLPPCGHGVTHPPLWKHESAGFFILHIWTWELKLKPKVNVRFQTLCS